MRRKLRVTNTDQPTQAAARRRPTASRKASVSMKDVAALAQVSLGTVSNVINSPELVSDTTRER